MSEGPENLSSQTPDARPGSVAPRWPKVVGTLGVIAGALMFLDKLDDLLLLPLMRSESWWEGWLGGEIASLVMRWMPPTAYIVVSGLIGLTLGALLFVGALRLRRSRRSGVTLCRTWSWLALAWLLAELSAAAWWVSRYADELSRLAPVDWQSGAAAGFILTFLILAALPVFFLVWFSRPEIETQLAGWPE